MDQVIVLYCIALYFIGCLNGEGKQSIIFINQQLRARPFLLIQSSYLKIIRSFWEIAFIIL